MRRLFQSIIFSNQCSTCHPGESWIREKNLKSPQKPKPSFPEVLNWRSRPPGWQRILDEPTLVEKVFRGLTITQWLVQRVTSQKKNQYWSIRSYHRVNPQSTSYPPWCNPTQDFGTRWYRTRNILVAGMGLEPIQPTLLHTGKKGVFGACSTYHSSVQVRIWTSNHSITVSILWLLLQYLYVCPL